MYKSNLSIVEVEEGMDLYRLSLTRFNVMVSAEGKGQLTAIFCQDRLQNFKFYVLERLIVAVIIKIYNSLLIKRINKYILHAISSFITVQ
jgi:hypothetical protein